METACTILAPDAETARPYARLRHEMEQPGVGAIPYHDLWIATLAEQHGLQVVSGDRHFDAMPGVRRLDW